MNVSTRLLTQPSFYGLLSWLVWFSLYITRLLEWNEATAEMVVISIGVIVCFAASAILSVSLPSRQTGKTIPSGLILIYALHVIGFVGLGVYIVTFSQALGGFDRFKMALVSESYRIRWEAESTESIGTQISYAGWLAIGLTAVHFATAKKRSRWLVAVAVLQFAGNFIFIDRTRPLWLLFTAVLSFTIARKLVATKKVLIVGFGLSVLSVLVFIVVGDWIGKTEFGGFQNSPIPKPLQPVVLYGTGGFAYFNDMLENNEPIAHVPERTLYPFFKILAAVGVTREPPSQINDIYAVPYETNVGTFLEPFYRDGGPWYMVFGILLHSFGFDFLARLFVKSGRPLAVFACANLCFADFISFFTPKLGNPPFVLFIALGIGAVGLQMLFRKRPSPLKYNEPTEAAANVRARSAAVR